MNVLFWFLVFWLSCGFITLAGMIITNLCWKIDFERWNLWLMGEHVLKGPWSLFCLCILFWDFYFESRYEKDNNKK